MDKARWLALMNALDIGENLDVFQQVVTAYSEPQRYYHTERHIAYCLDLLDSLGSNLQRRTEIECAIWFHDIVYKPMSKSNEVKSAEIARQFLNENGVADDITQRVHSLIMATLHQAVPTQTSAQTLIDIDLAILGDHPSVYAQFEEHVRLEYRLVPSVLYNKGRREILQSFLARDKIYFTEVIAEAREDQARSNLTWAISTLT